ncbi:hypothetical protein HGRIS_007135 [Hohenbuehelia grisea]|uniref:Uncharacterized protein n=1 Tax=Hohenbuehelia grisea TaxID=104357 RepID=A0ABR3JBP5_9AGAR
MDDFTSILALTESQGLETTLIIPADDWGGSQDDLDPLMMLTPLNLRRRFSRTSRSFTNPSFTRLPAHSSSSNLAQSHSSSAHHPPSPPPRHLYLDAPPPILLVEDANTSRLTYLLCYVM